MNINETTASPTARGIEVLRAWFRERHGPRDRRGARRPGERDFAVTEWADTQAAVIEPERHLPAPNA